MRKIIFRSFLLRILIRIRFSPRFYFSVDALHEPLIGFVNATYDRPFVASQVKKIIDFYSFFCRFVCRDEDHIQLT